jgi:DNA-binding LacI/PurR family transcriptional regulator
MVTIYDIAKQSGFAAGTVSKALNNYYGVNAETKQKIMKVAREMGYTPNANARALKAKRSYNIGVLFYLQGSLDLSQYLFVNILNEFKRVTEANGYDITLLAKGEKEGAEAFVQHCHVRQLDGVLIFGDYHGEVVQKLMNSDIPCVGFDYIGLQISGVMSDNYEKTKELISTLIGLGHERILFFSGEDNYVTEERRRGYYHAFSEAGVSPLPHEQATYANPEFAARITREFYPKLNPTAIVYPDDYSAIGGVNALRDLGLSVPQDVSVASFDGIAFAEVTSPKLTTVKQDVVGIGTALAKKLMRLIEFEDEPQEIITVAASVQMTGSCRKIG